MVFEKIANGVTKHYKIIIVIWIVALLVSVPAMLQVNSAVKYETGFNSGAEYESSKAQEIIRQHFQTSVANGTLLIVLQADNITDAEARDFVLTLQDRFTSSSELKYFDGVTTVYTYSEMVLDQAILELGPNMRPVEQLPLFFWGIPAMHLDNWTQSHSDSEAYNSTMIEIKEILDYIHADANTTALAYGYYNTFANFWNNSAYPLDPILRTTDSVEKAGNATIQQLPPSMAEMTPIIRAVLTTFDLSNFTNQTMVHNFALNAIGGMASITNMTFLQQIYDMGPSYDATAIHSFTQGIIKNETLSTYPMAIPEQLVSNFVSSNHKTMLLMVTFTVASDFVEKNGDKPMMDNVAALRSEISALKGDTGAAITTYVTGDAAISADMATSSSSDMELIEPITIVIILLLMGVLFRSVLAQFLPLGAVGVTIGVSQALVFVIGSTIAQIDYTVVTMLFAVLMGVGTDYSIFIITRYREERIKGAAREQAVHVAVTWAGESIVTSGATVIIAFFAMALSSFSFVQTMGLVLGLSIIVALLVALTLVPAVLMMVGNRMFWPTTGKRFEDYSRKLLQRKREGNHGYFHRAASFSVKHAKVIVVAAILVSIPTTYLFMTTETSFDFIGSMGKSESTDGMNAMTGDFGAGKIMPTQVVIAGDELVYNGASFNYEYLDAIDNITATIAADSMVQKVTGVTRPYGAWVDYRNMSALPAEIQLQLRTAMLSSVGNDSRSVLLTVVLKDQPQKAEAVNHIDDLRTMLAAEKEAQPMLGNSTVLVGGSTAMLYDVSLDTSQQFTNIEILVIIGIFIVLMIVLGSILLPLFAVVSIAMSITWSFAATTLLFGDLMGKPVLWLIPLILFVMLMGIGMDYNVFILTRIREEAQKGKDTKQAAIDAVDWTGGIITALALIMAGAFGSIMISSNAMLQEFGFALFLAVLLDAMVVRTYIVPAAIVLMGKWAWWAPGRLQRVGREEKMEAKNAEQGNGRQKTD